MKSQLCLIAMFALCVDSRLPKTSTSIHARAAAKCSTRAKLLVKATGSVQPQFTSDMEKACNTHWNTNAAEKTACVVAKNSMNAEIAAAKTDDQKLQIINDKLKTYVGASATRKEFTTKAELFVGADGKESWGNIQEFMLCFVGDCSLLPALFELNEEGEPKISSSMKTDCDASFTTTEKTECRKCANKISSIIFSTKDGSQRLTDIHAAFMAYTNNGANAARANFLNTMLPKYWGTVEELKTCTAQTAPACAGRTALITPDANGQAPIVKSMITDCAALPNSVEVGNCNSRKDQINTAINNAALTAIQKMEAVTNQLTQYAKMSTESANFVATKAISGWDGKSTYMTFITCQGAGNCALKSVLAIVDPQTSHSYLSAALITACSQTPCGSLTTDFQRCASKLNFLPISEEDRFNRAKGVIEGANLNALKPMKLGEWGTFEEFLKC